MCDRHAHDHSAHDHGAHAAPTHERRCPQERALQRSLRARPAPCARRDADFEALWRAAHEARRARRRALLAALPAPLLACAALAALLLVSGPTPEPTHDELLSSSTLLDARLRAPSALELALGDEGDEGDEGEREPLGALSGDPEDLWGELSPLDSSRGGWLLGDEWAADLDS